MYQDSVYKKTIKIGGVIRELGLLSLSMRMRSVVKVYLVVVFLLADILLPYATTTEWKHITKFMHVY